MIEIVHDVAARRRRVNVDVAQHTE